MLWLLRLRRLFKSAGREALILWYAFRHPGTPFAIKAASALLLLYLVSPLDVLPDFALLFGLVDDLAVFMIGVPFLVNRLPPEVAAQARARAEQLFSRFGGGAPRADQR